MLFFKKLFRGSYPLVKTFWLYYVLYSTLILLVAEGISSMFPNAFGAFSYILLGIVQLVYSMSALSASGGPPRTTRTPADQRSGQRWQRAT